MRNALSNVDSAMDFIRRAENEHPNRNDICQASTRAPGSTSASSSNPFGVNSAVPTLPAPGFGQPSVLGAKPNPFGASQQAFGQPSMPGSAGTFGQPSALGQKPNPFGAPSGGPALGQGTGSASGPFSAFAATANPFGTASQPAVANPFGQASQSTQAAPFGQRTAPTENPFAQSGARPNPFGQRTSQAQPSPFASTAKSTSFGVPSPPAQQNPFGRVSQPAQENSSGLGVNQAPPSNPFGQQKPASPLPNPFAQPASTSSPNPFGQRSSSSSDANPFAPSTQASQPKVNGTASQGPYGPNAQSQHPPLQSYVSKDGNQRLRMFKGKPVVYKDNEAGIQNRDGTWEKIWFPDGPPAYYGATELDDNAYTEDIKQAYLHARETGSFKDGVMPLLPPKREWCLWDF
jgi:nucleoporin NUP42